MTSLSIIVPVYNVERYLHQCIESVLTSSFTDYELILVDDGSTDNSGKMCNEYTKKDNRIRVFHQLNGGVSKARNTGIDKANAPWITFIDADDWISHTFLENLYQGIVEHPDVDFVSTGYSNYCDGKTISIEIQYTPYYGADMNHLCPIYRGRCHGKLFKKEILKHILFDEKIKSAEDLIFVTDYLALLGKMQGGGG